MWSPLSAFGVGGTGCADERDGANALQNAQREAIAYRLRIKELNVQIKEERQKATEKIRMLELKCAADNATSSEKRKSSDSGGVGSTASEGSHEVVALRKRADQLMLIKAASEFRILELEGKAKKYKARLTQVMRERNDMNRNDNRNDNMSVLGSVVSHASTNQPGLQRDSSGNGYGGMNVHHPHVERSPKKDKEEDRDDELASKIGAGFGSEEEMATLVLSRIRELDEELEEVKQELVQATSERDQLQMIKANLEAANIQNETKVPALEEEVAMFQMLLEKERAIINGLHEALDAEKNEIVAIEERKIEMEKTMAENVAMLDVFQKERADFEAQRNEMEKSLNKVRSQTNFLTAERNVEENKLKKQLERAMEVGITQQPFMQLSIHPVTLPPRTFQKNILSHTLTYPLTHPDTPFHKPLSPILSPSFHPLHTPLPPPFPLLSYLPSRLSCHSSLSPPSHLPSHPPRNEINYQPNDPSSPLT